MTDGSDQESQEVLGTEVAREVAQQARLVLGERVQAAYAIGSLAHGGFVATTSDVDVGLIVDGGAMSPQMHRRIVLTTRERCPGALSELLSLHWTDWEHVGADSAPGRFRPLDRTDLLRHGRLLMGEDRRGLAVEPARPARLADITSFTLQVLGSTENMSLLRDPAALCDRGHRRASKAVLLPVRLLWHVETDCLGSHEAAAAWHRTQGGAEADLVAAALGWRRSGRIQGQGLDALLRQIQIPYRRLVEALLRHIPNGEAELRSSLRTLLAQLVA